VWVLVPHVETDDPTLACYSDFSQSHGEFERAFEQLELAWRWQLVTMQDYRAVIDGIVRDASLHAPVIFNLCDGDEVNGVPGLSVVRYLNEVGLPYTGADERFYHVTTSKIDMKRAFDDASVPTSPWSVIGKGKRPLGGLFTEHGKPLIVKPAVSAGSLGISCKSVVSTVTALKEQLRVLEQGYHGWNLASGGVFVERYIKGPEFTTLIVGSTSAPREAIIYPAVERVFHDKLPATEKFLSFDRLWEVYEEEKPIEGGQYLWEYQPAPAALQQRIADVSWAAYASVGGRGYGRIDLRMDETTGEIYVLEVNAQCGLSEDENYTSIGAILRFANRTFPGMVREIVDGALASHNAVPLRRHA
jgi:D-alanine-D-alanine ligase